MLQEKQLSEIMQYSAI